MEKVLDKNGGENQKTRLYLVTFFFENRAVDNVEKYIQSERPQMTI